MMHARPIPLFLALLLAAPPGAHAQDSTPAADSGRIERATVSRAATFTSAYYAASFFVLGQTWYKDRAVVPFHFYNDNRAWLQGAIPRHRVQLHGAVGNPLVVLLGPHPDIPPDGVWHPPQLGAEPGERWGKRRESYSGRTNPSSRARATASLRPDAPNLP
jgi:hypothetical protein